MADSNGSPQRDDRHHRRSRSRSPVSPEWTGETPAEREERRLAEAAVLVGLPPPAQEPEPAEVTAPAAQAASPAARPGRVPRTPRKQRPQPQRATPRPRPRPPAHRRHGGQPRREGCRSRRGERGGRARGCDRGPGKPRHRLSRPRRDLQHATKAGEGPRTGHGRLAGGRRSSSSGQGEREVPCPRQPHHTHTSSSEPFPPKPFPPGRARHVRPPAPERSPPGVTLPQLQRQRDARRVIQEGGDGAQAELRASHGSAEQGTGGDRGSAQELAQGAGQGTRDREQGRSSGGGQSAGSGRRDSGQEARKGPGHGKGAQGRGRAPRCRERDEGRWASGRARAWGTGGGTRSTGRGPERGPKARARAPLAPRDRQDGAWEPRGEGGLKGVGRGAGHPARHPTDAGAPHSPPAPPPPPPLHHQP